VKETAGASEASEEVMTRSRMWFLSCVGKVYLTIEIERREKRQKLRGESVCRIIEINVEVAGNDEFVGCGCSKGEKRTEVVEKDREWFGMSGRRWRTIDIED